MVSGWYLVLKVERGEDEVIDPALKFVDLLIDFVNAVWADRSAATA